MLPEYTINFINQLKKRHGDGISRVFLSVFLCVLMFFLSEIRMSPIILVTFGVMLSSMYYYLMNLKASVGVSGVEKSIFLFDKTLAFNRRVCDLIKSRVPDYRSPWWYNSHLAAMVPFGYDPIMRFERQVFEGDSTSQFAVDWFPSPPPQSATNPNVIVFFPGLGLKSENKFCKQFVDTFMNKEEEKEKEETYYIAIVGARGVGLPLKKLTNCWYPSITKDGQFLIEHIRTSWVGAKVFLVGYSAGALGFSLYLFLSLSLFLSLYHYSHTLSLFISLSLSLLSFIYLLTHAPTAVLVNAPARVGISIYYIRLRHRHGPNTTAA